MEISLVRRFGTRGMDWVPTLGLIYYAITGEIYRTEARDLGDYARGAKEEALNILACLGYHIVAPVALAAAGNLVYRAVMQ